MSCPLPPSLRVGWGQDPGFRPLQHPDPLPPPVPQALPGAPPSAGSKEAKTTGLRKHHSSLMLHGPKTSTVL